MKFSTSKLKAVLLCVSIIFCNYMQSQITVGADLTPNKGSLLDLKEYNNPTQLANSGKGLGMPRVSLQRLEKLDPCVENATEEDKKKHTGLMVYNLTDDTPYGLCPGLYVWQTTEWTRLPEPCPKIYYNTKKILGIGLDNYSVGATSPNAGGSILLQNQAAFGEDSNSIVGFKGYTLDYLRIPSLVDIDYLGTLDAKLAEKPDIIVISYPSRILNQNTADKLNNYLNQNGVLILLLEDPGGVSADTQKSSQIFLRTVFGNTNITQKNTTSDAFSGSVYQYSTTINDEVINGPFGDLRGKYWGEDASYTSLVSGLPSDQIIEYSTAYDYSMGVANSGYINSFRHKTKNLIFVGDGGFIVYQKGSATPTAYPFGLDNNNIPVERANYGRGIKYNVSNSIFFGNVMAWAIKMAEYNGINTIP